MCPKYQEQKCLKEIKNHLQNYVSCHQIFVATEKKDQMFCSELIKTIFKVAKTQNFGKEISFQTKKGAFTQVKIVGPKTGLQFISVNAVMPSFFINQSQPSYLQFLHVAKAVKKDFNVD